MVHPRAGGLEAGLACAVPERRIAVAMFPSWSLRCIVLSFSPARYTRPMRFIVLAVAVLAASAGVALYLWGVPTSLSPGPDLDGLRSAAEQGDPYAQSELGFSYDTRRGVSQDYAEAVRWYRQAAEQGEPYAQFNLGVMYANGVGVLKDDAEAVRWWRLAAHQGHCEDRRFVPAFAGLARRSTTVRPRASGADRNWTCRCDTGLTLSPPVRGSRDLLATPAAKARSIPPRAGEPCRPSRLCRCSTVHPRYRGANVPSELVLGAPGGSSPPARGRSSRSDVHRFARRFIPARGGETPRRPEEDVEPKVHPRTRGADGARHPASAKCAGASPRARGDADHRKGRTSPVSRSSTTSQA